MCALEIAVTQVGSEEEEEGLSEETKIDATYQVPGTLQASSRSSGGEGQMSYFSDKVTQAQGSKAARPRPTENGRAGAGTRSA